jgi:hypothetical protein
VNAELRRAPDRSTRRIFFECAAVAVVVLFAYAASRPSAVATLGRLYDDVVYLSVGKSIADGHGYRSAQLVGTPVHAKFPPLLPAIYAVGWLAFGTLGVVAAMALWLNIVVASASAGVLWWLARRELGVSPVLAAPFVALPVVTDRTMFYFSGAASEPWMLLGWAVALVLARRLTRMVEPRTSATGTCVALGMTLAATALSRTQGAVIAIAVIAGLALSSVGLRRWLVVATTAAAPLAGWAVWHGAMMARGPLSQLPDQTSYLAWIPMRGVTDFARFAAAMTKLSVPLYWSNAADVLAGWTSPKTLALAATIVLVGLVGTALLARRFPEMSLSLLFTLGVLAIWPYVQDRFLTPVLPMLGVAGAFAAQRAIALVPTPVRRGSLAAAAVVTAMLSIANGRLRVASARGQASSPYALAISQMVDWIDRNTAPGDRIMVSWGGAIYLRTGRRTSIPNPEEPALAPSVLAVPHRFHATRLLADSVDDVIIWDRAPGRAAASLRALAGACPGVLTEVSQDSSSAAARNGVRFYRVRRDLPCLRELGRRGPVPNSTENKNAPIAGRFLSRLEPRPPKRHQLQESSLWGELRTAHPASGGP